MRSLPDLKETKTDEI